MPSFGVLFTRRFHQVVIGGTNKQVTITLEATNTVAGPAASAYL